MDQVRIRAAVAAHGLRKGQEVTVAETPVIAGGIGRVFVELERFPEPEIPDDTSHLLASPVNAERLEQSLEQAAAGDFAVHPLDADD